MIEEIINFENKLERIQTDIVTNPVGLHILFTVENESPKIEWGIEPNKKLREAGFKPEDDYMFLNTCAELFKHTEGLQANSRFDGKKMNESCVIFALILKIEAYEKAIIEWKHFINELFIEQASEYYNPINKESIKDDFLKFKQFLEEDVLLLIKIIQDETKNFNQGHTKNQIRIPKIHIYLNIDKSHFKIARSNRLENRKENEIHKTDEYLICDGLSSVVLIGN